MVRTKSGEQAKRLAAKLAAAEGSAPPNQPASPKESYIYPLGDLPTTEGAAPAVESAEEVRRAKTIAQTRKGAVLAATLCRTNFTEDYQGVCDEMVDMLGEGGPVPRNGWLGVMFPDIVKEAEEERFDVKEPRMPCSLAPKPGATEQDHNSLEAPPPTATAAPAAGRYCDLPPRLPPKAKRAGGEGRATADAAAPSAVAPGSSADHAAPQSAPAEAAGGWGDEGIGLVKVKPSNLSFLFRFAK